MRVIEEHDEEEESDEDDESEEQQVEQGQHGEVNEDHEECEQQQDEQQQQQQQQNTENQTKTMKNANSKTLNKNNTEKQKKTRKNVKGSVQSLWKMDIPTLNMENMQSTGHHLWMKVGQDQEDADNVDCQPTSDQVSSITPLAIFDDDGDLDEDIDVFYDATLIKEEDVVM
ncbi:hypothetical protein OS493_001950 [Desmophyllum pertusum]|uniref:Uncharacterized protein n=1 Tax=Desmophyllum pertusum TaxID=174260 RepID=A0A9X0CT76_9CNID|nr:hypothetical protein OS493_001950 [Desmophyllum pertusum]